MSSNEYPFVTLILPIRNEEKYIGRTLQSVIDQDYPSDRMEILLADGMSSDRTRKIIENLTARHPKVSISLYDNPKQIVPTGFNIGLRHAKGEVIVRVDGHCMIATDYVQRCVDALQETAASCVGGVQRAVGEGYIARTIALATSVPFGAGNARFRYSSKSGWVDTVYLGAYHREVFDRLGPFDEELVRNQDDEFNFRLTQAGGKVWLDPDIKSIYYNRGSLSSLWGQYFAYGYWKVRVFQKRRGIPTWRQLVPGALILTIAISIIFSVLYRILWPTVAVVGAYAIANMGASLWAARRQWPAIPLMPIVFSILHFSYGLGMYKGIWDFLVRRRFGKRDLKDVFTASAMSEIRRIEERYGRRRTLPPGRYSFFDAGNLFIEQALERHFVEGLRSAGFTNFQERRILDVGCGSGRRLQRFIDFGAPIENLFGIDLIEERIILARRMNPGMNFSRGNAERLPFKGELFDVVIQSTMFTSILDQDMKAEIAREMLRVLKTEGIIVWYDFHMDNPNNPDVRGVGRKEIQRLFPDCEISLKRVTLAPPIARRIVPISWTAAHLLEKLPFLRTHFFGVIRNRGGIRRY